MTEEQQNELIKAALELSERVKIMHKHGTGMMPETLRLCETIEKHRPTPKLVEGWLNVGPDGDWGLLHRAESGAIHRAAKADRTVHMREVVEKEWKPWKCGPIGHLHAVAKSTGEIIWSTDSGHDAQHIVDQHNKEMEVLAQS